jgi:hypothetical protein
MEAARFVVSDEVGVMWRRVLEDSGLARFAEQAMPQLVRWENRYGWTRSGFGQIAAKESSLASVLVSMLEAPDAWITVADR